MPDENSEKVIKLLEEIRDLIKERNSKAETILDLSRQRQDDAKKRYEETLERQKEAQKRVVARRQRFLWILTPLILIVIGLLAYLAFWVIPQSELRDTDRWMQQMRLMESHPATQPH